MANFANTANEMKNTIAASEKRKRKSANLSHSIAFARVSIKGEESLKGAEWGREREKK